MFSGGHTCTIRQNKRENCTNYTLLEICIFKTIFLSCGCNYFECEYGKCMTLNIKVKINKPSPLYKYLAALDLQRKLDIYSIINCKH